MKTLDPKNVLIEKKTLIDTALKRLQDLSDDIFNIDPDTVTWGDVGDLTHYADDLKDITDRAFNEGEYAPESGR